MRSIRTHLVLSLTVGVALLAGAAGAGLYAYTDEALERALDSALAAKAEAIAGAVHTEDDGQPHLRLPDAAASVAPHHDGPFTFQIWRGDGTTLARVGPPAAGDLPRLDGRRKRFADVRLPDGTTGRVTQLRFTAAPDEDEFDAHRARPATRAAEVLTMVVAHDRRSVDGPVEVLLSGLLFAAAAMVGGIVLIATWSVRRGLRPLAEVSRLADRIGPDSLDVRFPAGDAVPPELRPIGSKLNELVDRLQQAFAQERRFSAAVAHELRTPLAELRSLCDVALRWPDERATAEALGEARQIAVEIGGMVEALLTLARSQAGIELPRSQVVPLARAVADAWRKPSVAAAARGLAVECDLGECDVTVDPDLLAVVLRNLLENAVAHARAGGRVTVRCGTGGTGVTLRVGNACEPLDAGDVRHLFEAFWRKSSARTAGPHVGLGLSIIAAYCRAMRVGVAVSPQPADCFEVTLSFPANDGVGTIGQA